MRGGAGAGVRGFVWTADALRKQLADLAQAPQRARDVLDLAVLPEREEQRLEVDDEEVARAAEMTHLARLLVELDQDGPHRAEHDVPSRAVLLCVRHQRVGPRELVEGGLALALLVQCDTSLVECGGLWGHRGDRRSSARWPSGEAQGERDEDRQGGAAHGFLISAKVWLMTTLPSPAGYL